MIDRNCLFTREILDYQVSTARCGKRAYINLDNAATTPPFRSVESAVSEFLVSFGSVHRGAGTKSKISTQAYEDARKKIKAFVNAPSDSYLLFSGNTTGAMNIAAHFFSFLEGKVAVSSIEHSSSWLPWIEAEGIKALGSRQVQPAELSGINAQIQQLGLSQVLRYEVNEDSEFDLGSIEAVLRTHRVKALVLTASSNLTGYCPDIRNIGKLVHRYGALFVVDACQFIQHHALDMQALGIDFLAASGHKFYAPYGGGILVGPKRFFDSFLPYQIGGGNLPYITQEGRFLRYDTELAHDPGTPNAVAAISMATALGELERLGLDNVEAYETDLARCAFDALALNPRIKLHVLSKHLTTIIPFTITGMSCHEVAERLNADFGIGVRAGSFCVYGAVRSMLSVEDESEIVAAVEAGDCSGIPGVVRASFSLCNTKSDVLAFVEAVNAIAAENT